MRYKMVVCTRSRISIAFWGTLCNCWHWIQITKANNAASEGYYILRSHSFWSQEIPGKYVPEASSRSFCILLRKLEFVPDEYQKSVYIIWTKKKDMVSQSNLDNYNRISLYIFNKFLQKDWISPVHKVGLISKSFCKPNHYSEHYRLKEKMLSRVVIWHIFWRMEPK